MRYDVMILSGGFDPVHRGHVRMFKAAKEMADLVVVGINSNAWLERKKGKYFMDWWERAEILHIMEAVDETWAFDDDDNTACDLIHKVRKEFPRAKIAFGNGGDRTISNTPEQSACGVAEVELLWGIGGGKIQSSSKLLENIQGE